MSNNNGINFPTVVCVFVCAQAVDEHLKETQAQYQTLERKYSKAKRLIKEYQQK